MSNTATITITGVETKSGVSASGNAWTLYKVDGGGAKYSTFDAALGNLALASAGKTAEISFESTEKGNNLKTLTIVAQAAPPSVTPPPLASPIIPVVVPAQSWPESDGFKASNGDAPDWELIGLRKTRCALWAAILSNSSLNVAGADALAAFARELVIAAEKDIFERTGTSAPVTSPTFQDPDTDSIPF